MSFSLSFRETGSVGKLSHLKQAHPREVGDEGDDCDSSCSAFSVWMPTSFRFSCESDDRDRRKSKAALMTARRKTEARREKRMELGVERWKGTVEESRMNMGGDQGREQRRRESSDVVVLKLNI